MATAELKIPVFTVLKNGAILKNIFIVNAPPPPDGKKEAAEVVLVVGRHHDCDIVLTHPSISRFHLRIHSDHSSQKLSVTDLSSVHGTWVSGTKIEPGERVDLTEGDTLRVGGSSRVYGLHWIPLSQAYNLDQSFVSALDVSLAKVNEEEDPEAEGQDAVAAYQLKEYNEPSHKTTEEHSPCSEGQVVEAAEDGGLPMDIEPEEAKKFTDTQSKMEKENIPIANGEGEGTLDAECENPGKFEDTFPEEDRIEYHQNILTEGQEINSLDLIFGEMGPLALTSELLANGETSTGKIMFEDKSSFKVEEDEALSSPSDIDPNKIENPMRCSPLKDHCWTGNLMFADEKGDGQLSDDEFLVGSLNSEMENSHWSSGEGNEESKNLRPAFHLSDSSLSSLPVITAENGSQQKPLKDDLLLQHFLYSEMEFTPEDHTTQSCVDNDQIEQMDVFGLDLLRPTTEPLNLHPSGHNILSEVACRFGNKEIQPTRSSLSRERQTEEENLESPPVMSDTKSNSCNIWLRRGKPAAALRIQTESNTRRNSRSVALKSENGQNSKVHVEDKVVIGNLFAASDVEQEIFTPDKENMTPNTRKLKFMREIGKAGVLHSKPLGESSSITFSGPKVRHSKDASQFSDQENLVPVKSFTPDNLLRKSATAKKVFSSPIRYSEEAEEEDSVHSSDKENQTPQPLREHRVKLSSRKPSRLVKEILGEKGEERVPFESLHIHSGMKSDCNEDQTPNPLKEFRVKLSSRRPSSFHQEGHQKGDKRVPFGSLCIHSEMESDSNEPGGPLRSSSTVFNKKMGIPEVVGVFSNNANRNRMKTWIMVADTSSFLDKESRKSLQLLQGLRRTQLVIPRIVLSELDSFKRQHSWFRRNTEVSTMLEWIEATMLNSNWWIHVQNSSEESWAVAPTPRASPYSLETSDDFPMPFSLDPVEMVSPTTEDRVLEYAMLVRKRSYAGQLVLLSNDTSLKIKAMAEGILCETPAEFRESLVNPFSERFMWNGSSPRGQTWTLKDDFVPNENYSRHHLRKPSRGDGAGLKLILRHNSHYRQMKLLS